VVSSGFIPQNGLEWPYYQLGLLYKNQDKMDEAKKMYLRALQGYEKAWDPDHTSTLDTVNNLGTLYADQGKMDEAEKMYLRSGRSGDRSWTRFYYVILLVEMLENCKKDLIIFGSSRKDEIILVAKSFPPAATLKLSREKVKA
jgi:tetratricopeptide (TPR) repeat protein